jgi:hypothetical protein
MLSAVARGDHDSGVESHLLPGERILWEGRPLRYPLFRLGDVLLVPFSVLWCGFAVFWEIGVLADGAPIVFRVWGVPFVALGLYFVAGRFVVRAVASRRTRYTITSSRILVHGGWSGGRLTTAYLKSLPPPVITERPDGSGNLAFGAFPGIADAFTGGRRRAWSAWSSEPSATPILREVPDVRRVSDFVAHAQAQPDGLR